MSEPISQSSTDFGEVLHSWQIPEYHVYERGTTWYVVASVITILLVVYGVLSQNFLFALMVVLFAVIIFLHHTREPLKLEFAITNKGVLAHNRLYKYEDLESFWIIFEPPVTSNLYFGFKNSVRSPLSVFLDTQNPEEVKSTLRKFILENTDKKEEPLSDLLWKVLKL